MNGGYHGWDEPSSAGQSIVAVKIPRQLMVLPVAVLAALLGMRVPPIGSQKLVALCMLCAVSPSHSELGS